MARAAHRGQPHRRSRADRDGRRAAASPRAARRARRAHRRLLFGAGVLGASLLGGDDAPSGATPRCRPSPAPRPPTSAPLDPRDLRDAKDSVVPVRVRGRRPRGSGTGFVIDKGGDDRHERARRRGRQPGAGALRATRAPTSTREVARHRRLLRSRRAARRLVRHAEPAPAAARGLRQRPASATSPLAIGYPLGLDRTASASAGSSPGLGRSIEAPNSFSIDKVIQTDAAINPGNSGGPLLDSAGRVIGVNSAIAHRGGGGGSVGIGFAVPSNTVRQVVPRLERRRADRARVPRRADAREPRPGPARTSPASRRGAPGRRRRRAGRRRHRRRRRRAGRRARGHQRGDREPQARRRGRHRGPARAATSETLQRDARHAPRDRAGHGPSSGHAREP